MTVFFLIYNKKKFHIFDNVLVDEFKLPYVHVTHCTLSSYLFQKRLNHSIIW